MRQKIGTSPVLKMSAGFRIYRKSRWRIQKMKKENYIEQLIYRKGKDTFFITKPKNGYRYWYQISVEDLLDDGFSVDDLESILINTIYRIGSRGFIPLKTPHN